MDVMSTLKSIESIALATKEILPHFKGLNLGSVVALGKSPASIAPVVLVGGAALAIGAGVGLLLAPKAGADLRRELRSRANAMSSRLQTLAKRRKMDQSEDSADMSHVVTSVN